MYQAAGWSCVGRTKGFARSNGAAPTRTARESRCMSVAFAGTQTGGCAQAIPSGRVGAEPDGRGLRSPPAGVAVSACGVDGGSGFPPGPRPQTHHRLGAGRPHPCAPFGFSRLSWGGAIRRLAQSGRIGGARKLTQSRDRTVCSGVEIDPAPRCCQR